MILGNKLAEIIERLRKSAFELDVLIYRLDWSNVEETEILALEETKFLIGVLEHYASKP